MAPGHLSCSTSSQQRSREGIIDERRVLLLRVASQRRLVHERPTFPTLARAGWASRRALLLSFVWGAGLCRGHGDAGNAIWEAMARWMPVFIRGKVAGSTGII